MRQVKYAAIMFVAALLPAALASAQGVGSNIFAAACELKASKPTCACVSKKLQSTEPGRIFVEAFAAGQMTGEQGDDAVLALLSRYSLRGADLDGIAAQGKQMTRSYMNSCG